MARHRENWIYEPDGWFPLLPGKTGPHFYTWDEIVQWHKSQALPSNRCIKCEAEIGPNERTCNNCKRKAHNRRVSRYRNKNK